MTPNLKLETTLWGAGYQYIAGVDEVGRGSLAGPVTAAAVVFPQNHTRIYNIRDSKKLTPQQREALVKKIKKRAHCWAVASTSVEHINQHGIEPSVNRCLSKALNQVDADYALLDGNRYKPIGLKKLVPLQTIVKGDVKIYTIAAASILAKVYRDNYMVNLHKKLTHYGWKQNKGYGTKTHQKAILQHGICKHHRLQFVKVKS